MIRTDPEDARRVGAAIAGALGANETDAATVADSLVDADLRGHGSHGLRLLALYARHAEEGKLEPGASPVVEVLDDRHARVDGNRGFGQVAGREATDVLVDAARAEGSAVVGIDDTTHLGRIGAFGERVAAAGLVFAAWVNVTAGASAVAPVGSATRRLGTNPLCFAVPTFDARPFPVVLDMATSQVAIGKIRRAAAAGEPIPDAWTTTAAGEPLSDPDEFLAGEGGMLPLGGRDTGHKGFALAVIAELVAGVVGDGLISGQDGVRWGNSAAFVAIDPRVFTTREAVAARIEALDAYLGAAAYPDAVTTGRSTSGDRAVLPGEPEHEAAAENADRGLPLPEADVRDLVSLAGDLGVADAVPSAWG